MKIRQTAGAAVFSAGLVLSLASFAGATSGTIGDTGPRSNNQIRSNLSNSLQLTNNNDLSASSNNTQNAHTGSAKVGFNTSAGGAATGSAANYNAQNVSANVSNNSGLGAGFGGLVANDPGMASINLTGPQSNNQVELNSTNCVTVTNNNKVNVTSNNTQNATSGSAKVFGNTTAGSAVTGDATNSNSQTVNLSVSN
jgi:hypothetical protein